MLLGPFYLRSFMFSISRRRKPFLFSFSLRLLHQFFPGVPALADLLAHNIITVAELVENQRLDFPRFHHALVKERTRSLHDDAIYGSVEASALMVLISSFRIFLPNGKESVMIS